MYLWREQGVAPGLLASAAVTFGISTLLLRGARIATAVRPSMQEAARAAARLLRFSAPYTASMLVGTGVQFLLPSLVLHTLDAASVGYYRAATVISVNYLGFLISAMGMDYYPRLSAISHRPADVVRLVNEQYYLVLLLAAPMILGTMALAPYLIPLIYSSEFAPAARVLEWYLVGDLLKFLSWTIGMVILARGRSTTLFVVELISGANILVSSLLGMRWMGLPGVGAAFLFTYTVHYLLVWAIVRRDVGLSLTWRNKALMAAALCALLVVRVIPAVGFEAWRTPLSLVFAALAAAGSVYALSRVAGFPIRPACAHAES